MGGRGVEIGRGYLNMIYSTSLWAHFAVLGASIPQPVNPWAASKVGRPDFYVVRSNFFKEKRDFEDAPGVTPDGLCISKTNSTTGLKNYQRSYQLAMLALPAIFICSLTYCKGNRLRFRIKLSVQMIQVCQNNTDISK